MGGRRVGGSVHGRQSRYGQAELNPEANGLLWNDSIAPDCKSLITFGVEFMADTPTLNRAARRHQKPAEQDQIQRRWASVYQAAEYAGVGLRTIRE
jgi:hypothetical protein